MSQPPQWSADGRWWWDGQRWIPAAPPTRKPSRGWGLAAVLLVGGFSLLAGIGGAIAWVVFSLLGGVACAGANQTGADPSLARDCASYTTGVLWSGAIALLSGLVFVGTLTAAIIGALARRRR